MRSASICHSGPACFTPRAKTNNLRGRKRDVQVIICRWKMYLQGRTAENNKITSLQRAKWSRNQLKLFVTKNVSKPPATTAEPKSRTFIVFIVMLTVSARPLTAGGRFSDSLFQFKGSERNFVASVLIGRVFTSRGLCDMNEPPAIIAMQPKARRRRQQQRQQQ